MAMDEKGLGKRIQLSRKQAGLTQQELCQKANLSYSTLAKIERGAIKAPSIFTIQSIVTALEISFDALLGSASSQPIRQTLRTKSGVNFIYFDVNGCLVQFFQRGFTYLAEATNMPPDEIETVFWRYDEDVCRGTMSLSDFNTALAADLGVKDVDWQDYYLRAVEPIREMQELLKWAAQRYRIGLLTNTMPGFVTSMRARGIIPDINYDAVVESYEVGATKPEAAIYSTALERSGVSSGEILLIDDTRANLIAAEHAGWRVMWFDGLRINDSVKQLRKALEPAV